MPRIVVPTFEHTDRLDAFLSRASEQSRGRIHAALEQGLVFLNGERVKKPSTKLRGGEIIDYSIPAPPPTEIKGENIPLDILFEDDAIAVINKPAGLVVHPASGHWEGTLANALVHRFDKMPEETLRAGIVHRLDKDTSGILIVAKTAAAQQSLMKQFKDREVKKVYQVLVFGKLPAKEGTISKPIGRHPKNRKKMAVIVSGRHAVTHYRVIKQFKNFALLECRIETGRTHQIRVHLASIGHPVAGDEIYGKKGEKLEAPRQLLHAWKIAFAHPVTGKIMSFEAQIPEDFQGFIGEMMQGA